MRKKDNRDKKHCNKKIVIVLLIAVLGIGSFLGENGFSKPQEISYKEFCQKVKSNDVSEININMEKDSFTFKDRKDVKYKTSNPKYDDFKKDMLEKGIKVKENETLIDPAYGLMLILYVAFGVMLYQLYTGKKLFGNKEYKSQSSNTTFKDVAGLEEVKEDLKNIVDLIKNPDNYVKAGAKLPKGVLLYGPPGTGKTLLAKAVAGEAGGSFLAVSGSDFDEKYVGVGAQRVRSLFEWARKNTPCILFIDEIDALGQSRDMERNNRQTVNALLSEMDGFSQGSGIMVMAATNRLEDLDHALIRPGRFDCRFAVPLPATSEERKEIIRIHSRNKHFEDDVTEEWISKETIGYSPADIEAILNEAALMAARDNRGIIRKHDLEEGMFKKMMGGHKKKKNDRKEDEIYRTAWHEAGHALMALLLGEEIQKVSIIPSTTGASGVTVFDKKEKGLYTKDELMDQVCIMYGGMCAEAVYSDWSSISTGASADIKQATDILRSMICEYGMGSYGPVSLDKDVDESVMNEISKIAKETSEKVFETLKKNEELLAEIVYLLINRETISGEEILEAMVIQGGKMEVK